MESSETTAYVSNTCDGIQCPLCKRVMFPIALSASDGPLLKPKELENYFCGGESVVGDLKLDAGINLDRGGGTFQLEVGSTLHRAVWSIPTPSNVPESDSVHSVHAATEPLTAGPHTLSLAYVDATVIALMDGREIERRCIDVESPGIASSHIESIARITFTDVKGTLTKLDLSRDLYYTAAPKKSSRRSECRHRTTAAFQTLLREWRVRVRDSERQLSDAG